MPVSRIRDETAIFASYFNEVLATACATAIEGWVYSFLLGKMITCASVLRQQGWYAIDSALPPVVRHSRWFIITLCRHFSSGQIEESSGGAEVDFVTIVAQSVTHLRLTRLLNERQKAKKFLDRYAEYSAAVSHERVNAREFFNEKTGFE